ncbi:PucR family transcriptional regulator [Musicola paradisiaca]|uniref:Transcriptional regulator, PucR family n=1 Tax=Musicola paradisiaca (strain Ech703) TaxID=579405 RepID=C6CAB4_MUSP7|nr:PucR family transcriptional regulator [Musicola paradisiaca]ACS84589.1 transcriptional regulator, PucR family [Musicola paradisiaca Ech703]
MNLTVGEILTLNGLAELRLRAGAQGVHRPVRWYYVAENEGIAEWIMGGELVFVTGINHPRDEANLHRLLAEGHQRGIAGMVILTGKEFIHAIPDALLAQAEMWGIPLIEQPYSLKMVIVTQLIGTELVQRETALRSRREILIQLLTGEYPDIDILHQRTRHLRLSLETPRRIAALRLTNMQALFAASAPDDAEQQLQALRQRLQQYLEEQLSTLADSLPLIQLGELYILLLPCDRDDARQTNTWLLQLRQHIQADLSPLTLFIGLSAIQTAAGHYRQGLTEARRALEVAAGMRPDKGLCDYSELGVLQLLTAVGDPLLVNRFMKDTLGALMEHGRKHPAMLIETLDAVLQENGNLIKAAERLDIHRNTLHQRLQRIEQLTGHTLGDPQFRLNASVALLIWRMSGVPTPAAVPVNQGRTANQQESL